MGLSVKEVKQGTEILGGVVLRKSLRVGICMGPGPKVKQSGEIGSVYSG